MSYNKYQKRDFKNNEDRRYERNEEEVKKCKFCGEDIWWRVTKAGKYQPISLISSRCHFDECEKNGNK